MVSPKFQVAFLTNLQRLLSEGSFVATYKSALLLALADISVENGDDVGSALEITTQQIAEKFLTYYWRQSSPFVPRATNVDHFVPWARYPVDLGHNFVLAHSTCNSSKSDHVASAEYLEKWVDRNF